MVSGMKWSCKNSLTIHQAYQAREGHSDQLVIAEVNSNCTLKIEKFSRAIAA
jgi:hypothetical protein